MEDQIPDEASFKQLERLQVFLSYDPGNEKLWLDAAQLAVKLGDWLTAEALVRELPEVLKNKPLVNAISGQILLTLKKYPESLHHLLLATSDSTTHPSAWINLAYCYFYLERYSDAANALNENLSTKEMYLEEYAILSAKVAYHMDDSDKAIAHLIDLHEHHNAESAGFLSLLLFEDDQLEDATQMANLALAKNPHALEALISRASIYLSRGSNELAHTDIQLAVNYHPHAGRAWSTLAQIEFSNMKFESAKNAAQQAVEYMPDHIGTWHILGWSYLMLENYERALWAFEMSYELDRTFAETHGGLAYSHILLGHSELAKEHIKRAEKLDKDGFAATFAQTALMLSNNNLEGAREFLINWSTTLHSKLQATPQELVNKRMAELMSDKTNHKTVH